MASIAQRVSLVTVQQAVSRLGLRQDGFVTITKDYPALFEVESNTVDPPADALRFQEVPSLTYAGHVDLQVELIVGDREVTGDHHRFLTSILEVLRDPLLDGAA